MSKALTFIMIFTGTVFSVFLLNIVLYALVPSYHDALSSVIHPDDSIPVVEVTRPVTAAAEAELVDLTEGKELEATFEYLTDEDVALAASAEDTAKAASESGYGDYSAFHRAFRESFGVSPGKLTGKG